MATRGIYQTRQQDAVAELFKERPQDCLTAEEAYLALEERGLTIGKTTVYRAVTRLCECGRLRRYAAHESGEAARYQLNPCMETHLHIRCMDCGELDHLHCDETEAFRAHLLEHHGFLLDEAQTVLYGRCESCRRKEQQK